jgi:hypothetical protein
MKFLSKGMMAMNGSGDQITQKKLEQYFSGTDRLFDVLTPLVETEYRNDAVIQRFEFCYEMAWKLLKRLLEDKGIIESTPRSLSDGWILVNM